MIPSPNWCRTCGRHKNDPTAILCRDAFHWQNLVVSHAPDTGDDDFVKLCHDGRPCQNLYGKTATSAEVAEAVEERVEAVARAMWKADDDGDHDFPWFSEKADRYRMLARAAIGAMGGGK